MKKRSKYIGKYKAGDKFGSWTVIDGKIHGSPAKLDVVCECGTKKRSDLYSLIHNRSTNCGCKRAELTGSSAPHWTGTGSLTGTAIYRNAFRINSSGEGSVTSGDLKTAYMVQNGTCNITNLSLDSTNATVTKIDLTLPYQANNVAWVHSSAAPLVNSYGYNTAITISSYNIPNIFESMGMKPVQGDK